MSNRVLKRPMFRRGGMANQGIMTGLVDDCYQDGDLVTETQTQKGQGFYTYHGFYKPPSGKILKECRGS